MRSHGGDHFSGTRVTSSLKQPTRELRPGRPFCRALASPQASPYLVLLRTTLTVPLMSPSPRWALTPPFHPYLSRCERPKSLTPAIGGLFSVVLVSDRSAWTLSSVLALGVRTFLPSSTLDERAPVSPQRATKVYEPPDRDSSGEPSGTNATLEARGWAPVASTDRSAWPPTSIPPAARF